jgi:hypothetical protein
MKLKTGSELMKMISKIKETGDCAELFNYIDSLHSTLKNYQNLIDLIVSKNQNIEP